MVNLSFYVVKKDKNFNKFIICYHFSCKNPTQNNQSFCVIFAMIKLLQDNIPKNYYRLNSTIIFLLSCCVVGQKKCYRRPLVVGKFHNSWCAYLAKHIVQKGKQQISKEWTKQLTQMQAQSLKSCPIYLIHVCGSKSRGFGQKKKKNYRNRDETIPWP